MLTVGDLESAFEVEVEKEIDELWPEEQRQSETPKEEPQPEPEPSPEPTESVSSPPKEETNSKPQEEAVEELSDRPERYNQDWLVETLKIVKWHETTAMSWISSQFKVTPAKNLTATMDSLNDEQLRLFIEHLTAMREASGQ